MKLVSCFFIGWILSVVCLSANANDRQYAPWVLKSDSLLLYKGTTYRYTVDTPENEGLVSTLVGVEELKKQLKENGMEEFRLYSRNGMEKETGLPETGDYLQAVSSDKRLSIRVCKGALPPRLELDRTQMTIQTSGSLALNFYAGQRSPKMTVRIHIPDGIEMTLDNTTVNLIGRGEVLLREFSHQSIGRTGTDYSYKKPGEVTLYDDKGGGKVLELKGLDLRPSNGPDVSLCIKGVMLPSVGRYLFQAEYVTSEPEILYSSCAVAELDGVTTVSDFAKIPLKAPVYQKEPDFSLVSFLWTAPKDADSVTLLRSEDKGKTWSQVDVAIMPDETMTTVSRLAPDCLYAFKLRVEGGDNSGDSNIAWHYSGFWSAKALGLRGDGITDETDCLNKAIRLLNGYGGGVLHFSSGVYSVRTVHLQSNVWLELCRDAVIQAIPGADEPETTWFSDRAYRSGLSPTDPRPYEDPENYLTKQDVGHTFFRNTMFFGERIENVKIIGTGRITGNGHIVTTDKVMNNAKERRCDKMFVFKLCKNIEIGGRDIGKDMWYDEADDEPYYMEKDGSRSVNISNMLHIDQGGHFVLLATGSDGIYVHDTYFGKHSSKNARDIYDFMGCNDVTVTNIYSRVSSDDIVKLGSDCSLGFTRPARNYRIRNVVGDTNCNLFQIGSETADDIQNVYVDNIYVLGANKAGFSISTNDGGHVKNIYLNSGKTGSLHSRSQMRRTRTPFFISISNRGRVIGASVAPFSFLENGMVRKELLVTNVNIGKIENVVINGVDVKEVYGGSSFRGGRWKPFDGTQTESTPIIAGFKLPDTENVEGGLTFTLPNGLHTGYVSHIRFQDIHLRVKGGHPAEDKEAIPPEIGVGRYNVGDLKVQPAFGFWARHVKDFVLDNCRVEVEKEDGRYAVVLDDVQGADIKSLQVGGKNVEKDRDIKTIQSLDVVIE